MMANLRAHTAKLLLLVCCGVVGGCGVKPNDDADVRTVAPKQEPREPMFNMMDVFGDQSLLNAVSECRSVSAVRLKQPNYEEQDQMQIAASGSRLLLNEQLSVELAKTVSEESTYASDGIKGCAPDYGIRASLNTEAGQIDVFFCFGCNILTLYKDGKHVGGRDFDPGRARLLNVFKQVFSEDEDIQALE